MYQGETINKPKVTGNFLTWLRAGLESWTLDRGERERRQWDGASHAQNLDRLASSLYKCAASRRAVYYVSTTKWLYGTTCKEMGISSRFWLSIPSPYNLSSWRRCEKPIPSSLMPKAPPLTARCLSLTTAWVLILAWPCEKVASNLVLGSGFRQVLQFPPLPTNG